MKSNETVFGYLKRFVYPPFRWICSLLVNRDPDIFISYRHDDTQYPLRTHDMNLAKHTSVEAYAIAEFLKRRFKRVFFDFDDIQTGKDWRDEIKEAHRFSSVLLCLIGRKWHSVVGKNGKPRILDTKDVLRDELVLALEGKPQVLTVLVDGAELPKESQIPVQLLKRKFRYLETIGVDTNSEASLEYLAGEIRKSYDQFIEKAIDDRVEDVLWGIACVFLGGAILRSVFLLLVYLNASTIERLYGLAIVLTVILVLAPALWFRKCLRMIYRIRSTEPGFYSWSALAELYKCIWQAYGKWDVAHVAQVRTEAAILKPVKEKPKQLPGSAEYAEWKAELHKRRLAIDKVVDDALAMEIAKTTAAERPLLEIESCFELNNAKEQIERYFEELKQLYPPRSYDDRVPEFFCWIAIEQGFVAPQYLIAGLQSQFDEAWPKVLDWYGAEMSLEVPSDGYLLSRAIREIQVFQFLCWLMWGPSIPICQCSEWEPSHLDANLKQGAMLQFGYGDENNSWLLFDEPVVDPNSPRSQYLVREFLEDVMPKTPDSWAWQCSATVEPFAVLEQSANICHAQRRAKEESPIALRIKTISACENDENPHFGNRRIYQAYVWIMFVMCDEKGKPLYSGQPWLALLPFFTHGNIAEAKTHHFVRREVVRKSLDCLRELLLDAPKVSFRFACSSDTSNCGSSLAFNPPAPTMLEILQEQYDRLSDAEKCRISIPGKNHHLSDAPESLFRFSSCHLPEVIQEFYGYVAAQQAPVSTLKDDRK